MTFGTTLVYTYF
jgi:hypothetical protein